MPALNATAAPEPAAPQDPKVIFQPFSWHHRAQRGVAVTVDGGHLAAFAGGVRDVSAGVRHVMQIIETDDIASDDTDTQGRPVPALLGVQVKADLLRLAIFALARLEADSAKMIDHLDDQVGK